jgi:hypothetical protein
VSDDPHALFVCYFPCTSPLIPRGGGAFLLLVSAAFATVSRLCLSVCVCVCVWLHLRLCVRVRVSVCVCRSSVLTCLVTVCLARGCHGRLAGKKFDAVGKLYLKTRKAEAPVPGLSR